MDLSDKAYSTYQLLKRFTPLMEGLENATDEEIEKVCKEIVSCLKFKYIKERAK